MTKIHFAYEGAIGEFSPHGEYDTPVDSVLPHRFSLVDGKVVDKYNGMTDEEVRVKDHLDAVHTALNWVDHEGKPSPLTPPPPLGWVAPEDHQPGDEIPAATIKAVSLDEDHNKFAATLTPELNVTFPETSGGK
jgi:hypothetical protein